MVIQGRVGIRIVAAEMDAARLAAGGGGGDHEPGDDQHVLEGPARRILEFQRKDVAAPVVDAIGGLGQTVGVAGDPQPSPQEGAERLADVADVDPLLAVLDRRCGDGRYFEGTRAVLVEAGDDVLGRTRAIDQALDQAIRGEPIGPVEAGAGDLARRPEAGERGPTVQVHRCPADHVMSARTDWDRVAA